MAGAVSVDQVAKELATAREALAAFTAEHQEEIESARAEAESILAERAALDDEAAVEDARAELRALEAAKAEVRRLEERRAHFEARAHWLRLVVDLHALCQRTSADAGSYTPALFLRDAQQLVAFRAAFELLPLRGGKPPAVKKAVRPAMRDAARRLRGAGRALADSLLSFPSPTVAAVRRPPAGGAGEGWGGLAEVLEGLDALADMEEERGAAGGGGKGKVGGAGREVFARVLAGVEALLTPLLDGAVRPRARLQLCTRTRAPETSCTRNLFGTRARTRAGTRTRASAPAPSALPRARAPEARLGRGGWRHPPAPYRSPYHSPYCTLAGAGGVARAARGRRRDLGGRGGAAGRGRRGGRRPGCGAAAAVR